MESSRDRYPLFRFSSREMLLATVAVAAVVALFIQRRPFDTHAMLDSFDFRKSVRDACRDLGLAAQMASSSSGGSGMEGGYYVESTVRLKQLSLEDAERQLMPELQRRFESLLARDAGTIHSRGQGGSENFQRLERFSFGYHRGTIRGFVRCYLFPDRNDSLRLLITMNEY